MLEMMGGDFYCSAENRAFQTLEEPVQDSQNSALTDQLIQVAFWA